MAFTGPEKHAYDTVLVGVYEMANPFSSRFFHHTQDYKKEKSWLPDHRLMPSN
jgi:hypothetical protein